MPLNKLGKRVAVIGSRDYDDKGRLYEVLTKNKDKIKIIVSGGARGADTLATDWAKDFGFPYLVFPALWHDPITGEYDRGAGFRRNRYIIDHSDIIFAFWDGKSPGTASSVQIANDSNKRVIVIPFTPKPKKVVSAEELLSEVIEKIKIPEKEVKDEEVL